MRKRTKVSIGAGSILLASLVVFGVVRAKSPKLTEVQTAKVERGELTSKVIANGKIEAARKVDISANVMGQIVNLTVREGDVVKKGDFLLQIDRAQLAASAASAEASLNALLHDRDASRARQEEAELGYQRAQRSFDENLIPRADLERAGAALAAARAARAAAEQHIAQARSSLVGARDTLSKTTILAPIAGIVTRLPVEEGEVAVVGTMNNPGTVLMTISDMGVVEAVMEIDETDIPNVKIGQEAIVEVDAYPNQKFNGVVTEVGSSPLDRQAGDSEAIRFEVKIQLKNPPPDVRPGFSVSAEIITGRRADVISIPLQALVIREKETKQKMANADDEEGVYLVDPKSRKVKFAKVTTGITGETSIEIVTGVKAGNEIVSGPFKALREIKDGDQVKVAKEKKGEE